MDELASQPRKRKRRDRPPELSGDMCRTDLIEVLSMLGFKDGTSLLAIDRPVRDYIVRVLQRR